MKLRGKCHPVNSKKNQIAQDCKREASHYYGEFYSEKKENFGFIENYLK